MPIYPLVMGEGDSPYFMKTESKNSWVMGEHGVGGVWFSRELIVLQLITQYQRL